MKCSQCFALSKGVKEIRFTTITTIYRFINQKNDGGKAGCSYFFFHQRLNKQVQVRRHFKVLIEYKLMIIQHKITIAKVEKDEFRRGRKNCVQAANSNFLLALLALTLEEQLCYCCCSSDDVGVVFSLHIRICGGCSVL